MRDRIVAFQSALIEEGVQNGRAAEDGVEGEAREEALERVRAPRGEVGAEAVPADVLHALLVRERRHGAGDIILRERLVEEYEVGEAAAEGRDGLLEGREGGLSY